MGFAIRTKTKTMPIYASDPQRFELVASLYKGIRGHIKSMRANCDLASLTDVILRDDGMCFCTSSQSELIRKIKKHTSLIGTLQPFLLNPSDKCLCGHYNSEHEKIAFYPVGNVPTKWGKCKGKWQQGNGYIPCKRKCAKFELKPV